MSGARHGSDGSWTRRVGNAVHPSADEVLEVDRAMQELDRSEVARQVRADELAGSLDERRIDAIVAAATGEPTAAASRGHRRRRFPFAATLGALAAAAMLVAVLTLPADEGARAAREQAAHEERAAAVQAPAELVLPPPAPTLEAALPLLGQGTINRNRWLLAVSQVEGGCGRAIELLSELRREGEAPDACSHIATEICARLAEGMSLADPAPAVDELPHADALPRTLTMSLVDAADPELTRDQRIAAMLHLEHTIDRSLRALVAAAPQNQRERTIRDFCIERLRAELISLSPQ